MNTAQVVAAGVASGLPARFTVPLPTKAGYFLRDLREACAAHGRTLFRPWADETTLFGLEVHIDNVPAPPAIIALNMIVRDDVVGLERAIISAVDQVDEIVIAVDGRSGPDTARVAAAYADHVVVFTADMIELLDEDWNNNRIHFANARNVGRERVHAPWTLVLDADEYLTCPIDLRASVRALDPAVGGVTIAIGSAAFSHRDAQRLALTRFRFYSAMHNQLPIEGGTADAPEDVLISHDVNIRPVDEIQRRVAQRDHGIEALVAEARKGDLSALFHVAKHYIATDLERGLIYAEQYRMQTEIHGPLAGERAWLALGIVAQYVVLEDVLRAEQWALRALFDGPRVEAFVYLGEIAEEAGDLRRALAWFECACAVDMPPETFAIHGLIETRFERRDEVRALLDARTAANAKENPCPL